MISERWVKNCFHNHTSFYLFSTIIHKKKEIVRNLYKIFFSIYLYSMKIKEQTRKLVAGCSKHRFEVVDRTDEVSNHTYGKATLTPFEEIFGEY